MDGSICVRRLERDLADGGISCKLVRNYIRGKTSSHFSSPADRTAGEADFGSFLRTHGNLYKGLVLHRLLRAVGSYWDADLVFEVCVLFSCTEVEPQVPISCILVDSWLNAAFVGDARSAPPEA